MGSGLPATMSLPAAGVSIRDCVLIGPLADQPRGIQYASKSSKVLNSISASHFVAET